MDQGPMQCVRRGTLPDASGAEAAPGPRKRPDSEVKSHRTRVPGRAVRLRWATRPETPVPKTRNSGLLPDGRPCHRGRVRQGRRPSLAGRAGSTVAATRCGANAVSSTQVREGSHARHERAEAQIRIAASPHTAATERGSAEPQAVPRPWPSRRAPKVAVRISTSRFRIRHRLRRRNNAAEGRKRPRRAAHADPEPREPTKGASSLAECGVSEESAEARRRARTRNGDGASRGNPTAGSWRHAPKVVPPPKPTGRRIDRPAPRKTSGSRRIGLPQGASWSEDPSRALATKPRPKPDFRPGP